MDNAGQYQGSQAFSHIVPQENESVNPNTGSLNYRAQLVQLRGVRASIDLSLNASYNFGTSGTFGLPPNWSLDLPYVLNGKSLTANGRTYAIDYEWSDSTGYASGLRYMNNHGIRFEQVVPPQDLPSGLPGQYGYQLNQVDGSKIYFDVDGKPLQNSDIYGNFIYYSYLQGADGGVGEQTVLLDYIQDSWGQQINFEYQDAQEWQITLPDGSYTTVTFSEDGILSIQDPADLTTLFDYTPFVGNDSWKVLSTITYPTGLSSRYDWGTVEYLAADMSSQYMPKVNDHYQFDSKDSMYSHTSYDLGGFTGGNTYTGAAIGLKMAGATDTLMDGDGKALSYTYDVTKTRYLDDQDDRGASRTTTYFNNYHLPVRQIKYDLSSQGEFVEAYQTTYEYDIPIDEQARTTAYNYPKTTEVFNNTNPAGEPSWHALTRSTAEYNEYGNVTGTTTELDVPGRGYVKQTTTTNQYVTTSCNIQLVAMSVHRDEVTQSEDQTVNMQTDDGKAVASTTAFFLPGAGQPLRPWTKHSYEYDAQGRPIADTLAWAPDAHAPDGSVSTVTNRISYSFSSGTLTQTSYDADRNATVITYDMRRYAGPMTSKTLPLGQAETFEYDSICRLVRHTDALGHVTTNTYTVGPDGGSESVASPMGYVKLTRYDVLGRESEVLDNGDPTRPTSPDATRLLSRQAYDFLSRVRESTDNLGLVTRNTYDALSRTLTVTDARNNVLSSEYDDVNVRITKRLNGEVRSITQLNGRSDEIQVVTYPDSSDALTTYLLENNTAYDGNKRPISTALIQRPKAAGNEVTLEKTEIEYGPQSTIKSRTVTGSSQSGGQDSVKRQFTYDVFGNTYTWLKDTSYADGRTFQVKGPVSIYDSNNRVAVTRNQLGQEEKNYYDANGWLSKTVRFDKSEVVTTCDAVGQFVKTAYPTQPPSATELTYNADGRLTQVKDGAEVIKYETTLDGTLAKTTYPDGLTQVNTLDRYSRLVKQTDVFGVARATQYGSFGEVSSRSCKQDTVTYRYGTANHSEGQCIGFSLAGGRPYESKIEYDGFNRPRKTTATDSNGSVLLGSTYTLDGKGRAEKIATMSTTAPNLNISRDLSYDGLGQITSDSRSSGAPARTAYTYDGNSNVLSTTVDGHMNSMAYNAIDQRTDSGFKYDTLGRLLTDNQGYQYQFDGRDRLVSVQAAGATSGFEYRADDYLARRKGPSDTAEMYYNSGKINSMTVTKGGGKGNKTSVFSGSKAIVASYTDEKTPEYLFDSLGSTALVAGQDHNTAITYDAYGTAKPSSPVDTASSFGLGQEFTDQTSGLVYLRSRYYSPRLMAFVSMDRNHQENRYAYCEGDPINNFDPLGQSWEAIAGIAAIGVGTVVGAIATAGVSLAVEASLGAAVGLFGLSEVAAATASSVIGVASAAIGGATGNVIGGMVTAQMQGSSYTGANALVDALTGAVGGAAGKLMEPTAKAWAASARYGGSPLSPLAQEALASGITGAVNNGAQAIARPVLLGEPVNPLAVGGAMLRGFAAGAAWTYGSGKAKAQVRQASPRVRARARQLLSRVRGRAQAYRMREVDIYYDSAAELVAFRDLSSGASSSVEVDVSDLANSAMRSRLGTLSGEHEDLPPLITEL